MFSRKELLVIKNLFHLNKKVITKRATRLDNIVIMSPSDDSTLVYMWTTY